MEIITAGISSYKTAFVSSLHLSSESVELLRAMAADSECWFTHAVCEGAENAFILRFKAMAGEEWEDVEDGLKEHGFDSSFISLIDALAAADFDAVHFDRDMDMVQGAHWYTESGACVMPLAYELWIEQDKNDNNYFDLDGVKHYMDDFMRLDDESEMKSYGFAGYAGESNTSAMFIALSDDSDKVDVVRYV